MEPERVGAVTTLSTGLQRRHRDNVISAVSGRTQAAKPQPQPMHPASLTDTGCCQLLYLVVVVAADTSPSSSHHVTSIRFLSITDRGTARL